MKSARLPAILLIAAGLVGYAIWKSSETGVGEVKVIGFQDYDAPFEMPEGGEPDMRFHFLSAWQTNQIPTISEMDTPMGSENGALVYNARKFQEINEQGGGRHAGDDLNGIGGMDTDLGDPVHAAGDGLVVFAGEPSPGWGNVVVLAHRDPEGKPVHTMYAHLDGIRANLDSLVARGEVIGTVGTAGGRYPAHLHFEVRNSDGVDIAAGHDPQTLNRLDPATVIAALHDAGPDGISPAALRFAELAPDAPWTSLEIKGAENMPGLGE